MEREFLKNNSVLCQRKPVRYAYVKQHRKAYPVSIMASLLHVSVSRFYEWLKRSLSKRAIQGNQQTILVKIAHHENKKSYGYIRLTKHLHAQGVQIIQYTVRTISSCFNGYL